MSADEFTVVPVVQSFGTQTVIGELRILTAALPKTPGFVFSLGYSLGYQSVEPHDGYKLREVAMLQDENYIAYLRHIGKL